MSKLWSNGASDFSDLPVLRGYIEPRTETGIRSKLLKRSYQRHRLYDSALLFVRSAVGFGRSFQYFYENCGRRCDSKHANLFRDFIHFNRCGFNAAPRLGL